MGSRRGRRDGALTLVVGVVLLAIAGCTAAAGNPSGSPDQRLAFLKSKAGPLGTVAAMSGSDLASLVEAKERPYHIIASIGSPGCQQCALLTTALKGVLADTTYSKITVRQKDPVFFVVVELTEKDQMMVARYKLRFVPIFYHFAPGKSFPADLHSSSASLDFKGSSASNPFSANNLKRFFNQRLDSALPIQRTGPIAFKPIATQLLKVLIVLAGILVIIAIKFGFYKQPMFWFLVMAVIYAFGTSGSYYVFLHNSPLVVFTEQGIEFVQPGSRSMHAAEGILAVSAYVVISGALILAPLLPTHLTKSSVRGIVSIACISGIVAPAIFLYSMFAQKYPSHLVFNE